MDKARRIGHGQDAGQGRRRRQEPARLAQCGQVQGFGKEHLLGHEPVEQRHAGHGGGRNHRQGAGKRHVFPQAVDAAHVAGAGFVVDNAGGHEQRGLEGGVIDDMKDPGHGRQRRIDTEQQDDKAEMADRGIGQQALQIMPEQGGIGTVQQGDEAGAAHHQKPEIGTGEGREQPRQQEDAGLDHGGGMQVGTDRGRRRHGPGQPEMKRKLGRFSEGAEQDQQQGRGVEAVGADHVARLEDDRDPVAADDMAEQQETGEHGQAAAAGDCQGHLRALAGLGVAMAKGNQQE